MRYFFDLSKYSMDFEPDLDYVVDCIADAYVFVQQALDDDNIELAEFWQRELSIMTHGLDCWVAQHARK